MKITVFSNTYKVENNKILLGYMGETNARSIDVSYPEVEGADTYRLRFEYSDGVVYDVPIVDGKVTVTGSLLREVGDVNCQWIAAKSMGEKYVFVAKSNTFKVAVKPSIPDDIQPIPTYEQSKTVLEKLIAADAEISDKVVAAISAAESVESESRRVDENVAAATEMLSEINELSQTAESEFSQVVDVVEEVKGTVTQVQKNTATLSTTLSSNAYRRKYKRIFRRFSFPEGFDKISSKIKLLTDGCTFKYDFDITQYKNTGGTTYYVAPDASGASNKGFTKDNPTTLMELLQRTSPEPLKDNDTIIFADGIYRDIVGKYPQDGYSFNNSVNLIAENAGKVTIANIGAKLTYSHEGNGVYTTARSTVVKVVQKLDDDFTTTELKKVDSAEECSQEGTWFKDSTNVLYVHLFGDIEPTYENCFVLLDYHMPVIRSSGAGRTVNLYLEGINFIGGTCHRTNGDTVSGGTLMFYGSSNCESNLYAKDCKFLHSYDDGTGNEGLAKAKDAVSIVGANAFFVNCYAGFSSKDGFNYHKSFGVSPSFVEINCIGANNGVDGVAETIDSHSQNGSTAHDGAKGLRIGGVYYNNYGPNVADVNDNTVTININCTAFDSAYKGSSPTANADFSAQIEGSAMYLYSCKAFGSMTSAGAATGAEIYVENCDF